MTPRGIQARFPDPGDRAIKNGVLGRVLAAVGVQQHNTRVQPWQVVEAFGQLEEHTKQLRRDLADAQWNLGKMSDETRQAYPSHPSPRERRGQAKSQRPPEKRLRMVLRAMGTVPRWKTQTDEDHDGGGLAGAGAHVPRVPPARRGGRQRRSCESARTSRLSMATGKAGGHEHAVAGRCSLVAVATSTRTSSLNLCLAPRTQPQVAL